MLTVSFPLRAKTIWNPLCLNTKICRRELGHNSFALECRMSAGRLFRQKPRKYCQLETQASWMLEATVGLFIFCMNKKAIFSVLSICLNINGKMLHITEISVLQHFQWHHEVWGNDVSLNHLYLQSRRKNTCKLMLNTKSLIIFVFVPRLGFQWFYRHFLFL